MTISHFYLQPSPPSIFSMSKPNREQTGFQQEITAIICLFTGVFLLLCLVSYAQPLLGQHPTPQSVGDNWCGRVGYYVAHFLFYIFGTISFFPILVFFYLAVAVCLPHRNINRLPSIIVGITGILIAASGLLSTIEQLIFPSQYITPGGYLGETVRQLLERVFGSVGSVMLLFLALIFSLMAAVRFSPFGLGNWLWTRMLLLSKKVLTRNPVLNSPDEQPEIRNKKPKITPKVIEPQIEAKSASTPSRPAVHEPVKPEMVEEPEESEFTLKPVTIGNYQLPSVNLLVRNDQEDMEIDRKHYYKVSETLLAKLADFNVKGEVVGVSPGPVVTTYEFSPAPGIKINKIASLADDLAMVLKVDRVRVVGSIPGKAAIGIEIPNPVRRMVFLRDILLGNAYTRSKSRLTLALGFDVVGRPVVADLGRMPHLLIAGATGAGKSVAINAFIASILYKATPDEVRMLMIDPKRIELSAYEGIPHLLHPVVVEPKMASRALMWAVREMERRYKLLEELRVKSFASYNEVAEEKLPYIVIIVDELADLMMVASKDVETSIARLAQMARAAGMHIILATQRPSVDVLTGLIKANFPTRLSFKVSSKVDSRTILDGSGAEHLLGLGDMLFLPPGAAKLQRIHGAYISEEETERMIAFLKQQGSAVYDESVLKVVEEEDGGTEGGVEEYDEKYDEAVAIVTETGQASISMVQRRLRVGYNRAARMIEVMEREGIVGPADGSRPREVLARGDYS